MDASNNEGKEVLSSPYFRIWTCGAFRVERRIGSSYEVVRTAEWGGSSYPRLLLKALLCCPGRQARREALIEMLWPEAEPEQAAQYLNTATTKLRKVLQPAKGRASLLTTEDDYKLYRVEGQPGLWVDIDGALALLKEAERMGRTSLQALPILEQAEGYLSQGVFLEEEEGLWASSRRATVDQACYRCRIWLAEAYEQQGNLGLAEVTLSALLEDDPTDEDVLCRLMLLLHQQGMTHRALHLYKQTCEALSRDRQEPTEVIKQLATQLSEQRHEKVILPDRALVPVPNPSRAIAQSIPEGAAQDRVGRGQELEESDMNQSRRAFLTQDIPVLLGFEAWAILPSFSPLPSSFTKPALSDQEVLRAYQSLLPFLWEAHYTSNRPITLQEIEVIIQDLCRIAVYGNEPQQGQLLALLCQYHQFALNLARDQGHFEPALYHARQALLLATKIGDNELVAASLYWRGLAHFDMRQFALAANDLCDALPFARLARPQLQGMVHLEAARFLAHLESSEKAQIYQLLDHTQQLVENGPLEDDAGYVRLDKGRYAIGRAATFLALKKSSEAREELDVAAQLTLQEQKRRHAYITLLRARTYFVEGNFDYSTDLALDAATTCLAIQSKSNLADLARLYVSLTQTSFHPKPTLVQLGVMVCPRH
jgi:DNA-binding SARP family transcriptional activator